QNLKPVSVQDWHNTLMRTRVRGKKRMLSARTVGHAHRVLHRALQRAVEAEILARNPATAIKPPKVEEEEIEILTAQQIADVVRKLEGHPLHTIAVVDLATGLRRGEILAVRLSDLDLDGATIHIKRSLEETKDGLRIKLPKTKHGKRSLSLPPNAVAVLRE